MQKLAATKITFDCDFNESVWCPINLNNNDKMVIGFIYRRPNAILENNQLLYQLRNIVI